MSNRQGGTIWDDQAVAPIEEGAIRSSANAELAQELRRLRDRAGPSLAQLAKHCWCGKSSMERYLNGKVFPPREVVAAISDACGGDTAAILAMWERAWAARDGEQLPDSVTPRQLPPDISDFTGREAALAELAELLSSEAGERPVVIATIAGAAGVGKSALAIRSAHRLAESFPDGQLYADLHGATVGLNPLAPLEVLGRFLRAVGVSAGAIPADVEEATALFRSRVAGRQLLVVLDNAADTAQVRPLLPATPGCAVLVTSRRVLSGLEGARHLRLEVLPPRAAIELLGQLSGADRVAAERKAAEDVARWCGWLPLALRIAGSRLVTRPEWPLRALAERLADAKGRLDELELADIGVRTTFTVSFEQMRASTDPVDRAAAEAFGLLGMLDGPDAGVPVTARLLDRAEGATERLLERLVDAHLIESPAPGRYRMHDLLRLYAREVGAEHVPASARAAALRRALGFYVATAWHTFEVLRPGDYRLARADARWRADGLRFPDERGAVAWLEVERANLLSAVRQAAVASGVPAELTIQLTQALYGFLWSHSYWEDFAQVNEIALGVARRIGDRGAEAQARHDLGSAGWRRGNYELAMASLDRALAIRRELDDRQGQAASLGTLGMVHERQGRLAEALAYERESLATYRALGDRRGESTALTNLGNVFERLEQYAEALSCHLDALVIDRELGDRIGEAISLTNVGYNLVRQGRWADSLGYLRESLAIRRRVGDRSGQAYSLSNLGLAYHRLGRHAEALQCQLEGLGIRRELGAPHDQAESLRQLGETFAALGQATDAAGCWVEALAIFERLGVPEADGVRAALNELDRVPADQA